MSEILKNFSNELTNIVNAAGQSVVSVRGRRRFPASGVAWTTKGVVVTANHVLERDDDISVGLPSGQTATASLVGRDPSTDIAVLKLEASGLAAPSWTEADSLRVGSLVLALGRPGQNIRATLGIISAVGDAWRTPAGGRIDRYVQPDLVMYPGFSGGPLIDASGAVLGINSSALLRGASVTIPASTVKVVAETLQAHGKISRGYLGVGAQTVGLPENVAKQIDQETALLLVSVESGSPAEQGGLTLGDTILGFDGEAVKHMDDLLQALAEKKVGSQVTVRVLRGGQIKEVKVTIGERP